MRATTTAKAIAINRVTRAVARQPLGQTIKVSMPYFEYDVQVNPGLLGIVGTYVFSANGLYDPNITGVGHQPLGFDQLMLMYNHYTVIGARITVDFVNNDTTYNQYVGIKIAASPSPSTDLATVLENGNCVYTLLGQAGNDNDMATLSYGTSIGKFLTKKNVLDEDDLKGTNAANPEEQVYFHVFGAPNTAQDAGTISLGVRIDYIAVLHEPTTLSKS